MSGRSCGNGGNSSHWAAITDSQRRGHSSEPGNPSRRAWFVPKWPNMCTHIHRLIPRMELNMVIHMFTHVYLHRIVSMRKNAAKSASRTVLRSAASATLCCAAQRMLHSGAPGNKHGLAALHCRWPHPLEIRAACLRLGHSDGPALQRTVFTKLRRAAPRTQADISNLSISA